MLNASEKPSRIRTFLNSLIRRFRKMQPPQFPGDPAAYRMAPVHRGPKGRSGAAVAEPEDDSFREFPPRRS